MTNPWLNKCVLITGVCGTVGKGLLRQLVGYQSVEIIGVDNNESELFFLDDFYRSDPRISFYLCDMRDRDRLKDRTRGIDIILHTAAYKHVILCEHSPWDAIQTNIVGAQNLIEAAISNGVERVLLTSTDKAVNPTSVMGTSKLMGERLMTAANVQRRGSKPIFTSSRFGNVLGSRGSVLSIFEQQIAAGGPVTLTDRSMTRFIMTLEQAVELMVDAVFMAWGGEVFVSKMPIARIEDLAAVMIEELAPAYGFAADQIEVKVIGTKPGEKLYEELINDEETRRVVELERHFAVLPAFQSVYEHVSYDYPDSSSKGIEQPYNSAVGKPMDREQLRHFLLDNNQLDKEGKVAS